MTLPSTLPHRLDRSLVIAAEPETVFRFFTDSTRWAAWWGAGSTIDARRGGRFVIRYPNGVEASGEVLDVDAPRRLVLTYGYASGTPIPPGTSRVTIRLVPEGDGTRLHLAHEFADAAVCEEHAQGWRFQLSLFSNLVTSEVYANAVALVDAWFDAWSETDVNRRGELLARISAPHVRMRDRYSAIDGLPDLIAHLTAMQRFAPGMRLARAGDVRRCQDTALADWVACAADGSERGRGTNVFVFANHRIDSVTGFWDASSAGS